MSETRDSWASALLLHLLSDRASDIEVERPLAGATEALITRKTAELSHLLLHLQCTPVQQRSEQAERLEQSISRVVKEIAGAKCGPYSEPRPGYGHKNSERQANFSRDTNDGSLQLSDTYKLDARVINAWVDKHFIDNEAAASRRVQSASSESSNKLLPSHLTMDGVEDPISTIRLATFTDPRLFGEMLHDPNRASQSSAPTVSSGGQQSTHSSESNQCADPFGSFDMAANSLEAAGVTPDAVNVLLRIFEGAAPTQLSLQQAGEVLEAMDYCLVEPELYAAFVTYLRPMLQCMLPEQMVWILARCLNHAPEEYLSELPAMVLSTAAAAGSSDKRATFVKRASGTTRAGARSGAGPLEVSDVRAAADTAQRELSRLHRGVKHTLALLLVAEMPGAPLWLRVGSLAATAAAGNLGSGSSGSCSAEGVWSDAVSVTTDSESTLSSRDGGLTTQWLLQQESVTDREVIVAAAAVAAAVNGACSEHSGLVEGVMKEACAAATQPGAETPQQAAALPLLAAMLYAIGVSGAAAGGLAQARDLSRQNSVGGQGFWRLMPRNHKRRGESAREAAGRERSETPLAAALARMYKASGNCDDDDFWREMLQPASHLSVAVSSRRSSCQKLRGVE